MLRRDVILRCRNMKQTDKCHALKLLEQCHPVNCQNAVEDFSELKIFPIKHAP